MRIELTPALNIDGWMTFPELFWLAKQAKQHKVIAEIGSFLGRSTRALADNTDGIVYAFDDWYGPRGEGDSVFDPQERETFFDRFIRNMNGLENRVKPVRVSHSQINPDICPDMIFIDGDHSYEGVKRDIELWKRCAAPGALLCGHDITAFSGVARAVEELLPEAQVVPDTDIWFTYLNHSA